MEPEEVKAEMPVAEPPHVLTASEQASLDNVFSHHKPEESQIPKYTAIREAGKALAAQIFLHVAPCADRSDALRKVREVVMTANSAIALNGAHLR